MSDIARLREYLSNIIVATDRIAAFTAGMDFSAFQTDLRTQDAVIRNIEIIGEAANRIVRNYPQFVETHSELPLRAAYEMRNVVAHGYFKVDIQIVWNTVQDDLPQLGLQLRQVMEELP